MGGDAFALIIDRGEIVIPVTGEVNDLESLILQERRRSEKELIDAGGSLASPHHQKRVLRGIETEGGAGIRRCEHRPQIPANGCPRDDAKA